MRSEMAAAGNNRFAVTCGLLRQYMREHKQQQSQQQTGSPAGSFLPPPPREAMDAEETDARTKQLFPTHAGTSQQPSQKRREEQARTPLTIFYEGRVIVFEGFPADKVKDLMQLARSGSSPALKNEVPVVPEKPAATEPPSSFPSDLPIARKASLKMFLQKRKHRIISTDPYQKETVPGKEAADKPANGESPASWLAL